jgi:hypothetical protein
MQYQVPQFIEIEDKIFGPLTFKQFAYLAGAGGIGLLLFTLLPLWLAILLWLPFGAFGGALAFYQVNGRPFIQAVENALGFYSGSKLYLWKQRSETNLQPTTNNQQPAQNIPPLPAMSESKLKDLAWSLNIKDRQKMGITSSTPSGFEL